MMLGDIFVHPYISESLANILAVVMGNDEQRATQAWKLPNNFSPEGGIKILTRVLGKEESFEASDKEKTTWK